MVSLVHLPNQLVDVRLPVTKVTTLHKVLELACSPATSWVGQFEGPEEIGCLFMVQYGSPTINMGYRPA